MPGGVGGARASLASTRFDAAAGGNQRQSGQYVPRGRGRLPPTLQSTSLTEAEPTPAFVLAHVSGARSIRAAAFVRKPKSRMPRQRSARLPVLREKSSWRAAASGSSRRPLPVRRRAGRRTRLQVLLLAPDPESQCLPFCHRFAIRSADDAVRLSARNGGQPPNQTRGDQSGATVQPPDRGGVAPVAPTSTVETGRPCAPNC